MKIGRVLGAIVAVLIVFVLALALFFPTEDVGRRAVVEATPPGWPTPIFARAGLRPTGIVLDDVTFRDPTGAAVLHAGRLHVMPSLVSLLRGGNGLPLTIGFEDVCQGQGKATVTPEGDATAVDLVFDQADLASCPPLAIAGCALKGRAAGTAQLRLAPAGGIEGAGEVALTRASWRGANAFAQLFTDSAAVRWRLQGGRLTLDGIDIRAPQLAISGSGIVRLADPVAASRVDFDMTMGSAPGAGGNPFTVAGTLAHPEVTFR